MIFRKLNAGMVALVAASSLLLSPPASADPLDLPAPKAGPAATAVAETARARCDPQRGCRRQPQDERSFRKLSATDGGWRFVATDLEARVTDTIMVLASTGGRLGCVAVLNRQAPPYGVSFCRSEALGLFVIRRVPDTQRYTIRFLVGGVRPSSRWEMQVGMRTDSAEGAVVDDVRAGTRGSCGPR